jgi:biotin synthase
VVERAINFERDGADEIYLMTTANYPVERFIEIGQDVRKALGPQTELIANIGDFELPTAYRLLDAGYAGVYHVYRFREGLDTDIEPERRRATFRAIKEAGLGLRYCVEPVGPEHSAEEIVEQMMLAREFGAEILSVMRRVPVPGTPNQRSGELTEPEIARIVAVARLTLGRQIRQMGVHEPSLVSLRAGAHRICAEVGMNPRDLKVDTAAGRGLSVQDCEDLLKSAGFSHESRLAPVR